MAAVPKNGEYQEGHAWFQRKGSMITLGLSSLAIEEMGAVERVELPEEGEDFQKGDVVATLSGSQGKIEFTTPASGFVKELNENLKDEPETVSEDPLEEGWLIKLEIEDTSELQEFANPID